MALPVLDASASANGGGASNTFANILTVGAGDNRVLIAAISVQDSNHANLPITAVKWGGASGQAFTKICEEEPSDNVRVEIWALLNPDTGLKDLYVAATGSVWKGVILSSWRGAKQTLSLLSAVAFGNSDSPSMDITTGSSDSVVIDVLSSEAPRIAVGGGQTSLGTSQGQPYENAASSYETKANPGAVTMSDTLSSGVPWAIAAVAIEPAQIVTIAKRKRFKYMVYSSAGVFKKRWMDVYSEPRFSSELNGGFSELVVELARSAVLFGEDSDIKYGNQLKLWCFDDGAPNGVIVYSGELTRYVPSIHGRVETLKVTFLGYWQQAARIVMEDAGTGSTILQYSSQDPGNILKDILDRFTAAGGKIDYVTSPSNSVDLTGDTQSYEFNMNTYQEAMKKIVDMCPAGWYVRVGADDIVYLKAKNTNPDHEFILGQHISEYEPEKRTESLVNRVFIMGGDPGTGVLYKKYTRSGSVSNYGKWDRRIIDGRVTVIATMDDIAARILDNFDAPEIRIVAKILDNNNEQGKGYDIESIFVGQTCKILNSTKQSENKWDQVSWDSSSWDYDVTNAAAILLQIQRIEYSPDFVILELSNRQPDIARRVEDINSRLLDAQTVDTPSIPTT